MVTDSDPSTARKRACLEAAIAACCGDRALNYGKPEDNFKRIAMLWTAWFSIRPPAVYPQELLSFSSFDVAVMNILLKIARLANTPSHADSWIDIAGYAACGADITGAGPQAKQQETPAVSITPRKCSKCRSERLELLRASPGNMEYLVCLQCGEFNPQ